MKKIIPFVFLALSTFSTPLLAEDKSPPSVKDTKHGDWMLRLSADPSRDSLNHIFTASRSKDGKYNLQLGVLYADAAKDWVVVYRFNPTADKEKGVEIAFPNGIKGNLPIPTCTEEYCQAEVSKNTSGFLNYLKSNPKGTLTFIEKDTGTAVPMPFSLNGFGKAFDELQKAQKSAKKSGSTPEAKPEEGPDHSAQD